MSLNRKRLRNCGTIDEKEVNGMHSGLLLVLRCSSGLYRALRGRYKYIKHTIPSRSGRHLCIVPSSSRSPALLRIKIRG